MRLYLNCFVLKSAADLLTPPFHSVPSICKSQNIGVGSGRHISRRWLISRGRRSDRWQLEVVTSSWRPRVEWMSAGKNQAVLKCSEEHSVTCVYSNKYICMRCTAANIAWRSLGWWVYHETLNIQVHLKKDCKRLT